MRLNIEGSYFSPNDTINDTIKLMEEIIKDTGESARLSIGIDCNANGYYNETTKKYDMDGMKQPPEADALIEYYFKYCTDHPLITYMEDPIADVDLAGWKKIFAKFESKPTVQIASKNLISESLTNIKHVFLYIILVD
jgi:enolase